jgi:hypothetical protein
MIGDDPAGAEPPHLRDGMYPAYLEYVPTRCCWSLSLLLGPTVAHRHDFDPGPLPPSQAARRAVLADWRAHARVEGAEPAAWRWREKPSPVAGLSRLTADLWVIVVGDGLEEKTIAVPDDAPPADEELARVIGGLRPTYLNYVLHRRGWSMTLTVESGSGRQHDFAPGPLPPTPASRMQVLSRWRAHARVEGLGVPEWRWREKPSPVVGCSQLTAELWVVLEETERPR